MKFIYPAIFRQNKNGYYEGYFPDLEECYANGETLEEAVESANEAAANWISVELEEEGATLPSVSEISDLTLGDNDIVRNIAVNLRFYDGWDE